MPRGDKPTTTALALKDGWIYEDALPMTITKEQYDWWHKESLVLDGVRMGPPLPGHPQHPPLEPPRWTVHYNIVSPESDRWVGTGWEFFDNEAQATDCYRRQGKLGNVPSKRPFYPAVDTVHLGIADQHRLRSRAPVVATVNAVSDLISREAAMKASKLGCGCPWPECSPTCYIGYLCGLVIERLRTLPPNEVEEGS
jgi:hypothetical protein